MSGRCKRIEQEAMLINVVGFAKDGRDLMLVTEGPLKNRISDILHTPHINFVP